MTGDGVVEGVEKASLPQPDCVLFAAFRVSLMHIQPYIRYIDACFIERNIVSRVGF